jgi:hypothetical protein
MGKTKKEGSQRGVTVPLGHQTQTVRFQIRVNSTE